MKLNTEFFFEKIFLQKIIARWLDEKKVSLHILRLDAMHEIISGNKWFKLKHFIDHAIKNNFETVATFGGAYSNHIIATAYACKLSALKSIGIIRGEEPEKLSHTLINAQNLGMKLFFVKREDYKNFNKNIFQNAFWIEEGGYGIKGVEGAHEILQLLKDKNIYSHIICAVGTGTTLAGIIKAANPQQQMIGISVMKNNISLENEVAALLNENDQQKKFTVIHDYHFGGYAKHTKELLSFMNETWQQHQLPTDFVYTAKTFFAIKNMVEAEKISRGSNILMIHTGGLQGNLSLPSGTLQF
jgi:1-aminocyclopropane-1-carboxylate deaminase/D-cysteine desulfhydrase-like pyridoxal-dependent ACC family enzyme